MNSKIMNKRALALMLCTLTLSAASTAAMPYTPALAFESTQTETDHAVTSATVTIRTLEDSYKTEDGKVVKTVMYERPIFEGNSASIRKINKFYARTQAKWVKAAKEDMKTVEEDEEYFNSEYFTPYSDEVKTQVTYNRNGIVCILQEGYYYTGGAHGMPYRVAHTFDLNTGEELSLTDILSGDDVEIKNTIVSLFEKRMKKLDYVFDDALDTVKSTAGTDSQFYLGKHSIIFYYPPYDLAPYAAGYVQCWMKYTTEGKFKLDLE
ncbi:MAG: DUF3298 and DUF4163 domain-containing protein [Lachnospiraceae bacterium]|nr:DUF3298 and DUF4163 domain-containing protein [Lachnospiraceae bacterium]